MTVSLLSITHEEALRSVCLEEVSRGEQSQ